MATEAFFDTNVPLYVFSGDARKAAKARELLKAGGVISVQVLNEFALVALRKYALTWDELYEALESVRAAFRIEPLTLHTHMRGIELARRYRLRIYDAMILAAAELAGSDTVYSEDMQDGLQIGGLTICNPFKP
ncbi:MAG: PIN domain-containing protein [Phenylobacterium sp.]